MYDHLLRDLKQNFPVHIVICNYLGIVMSSSGAFIQATNTLSAKALRAMNSLFTVSKSMNVPVKIMFNLFDA